MVGFGKASSSKLEMPDSGNYAANSRFAKYLLPESAITIGSDAGFSCQLTNFM